MSTIDHPIVVFDSGVGGLTVLNECFKALPHENYIYYADVQNVPYGNKDRELVKSYILKAIAVIAKEPLKALVMACNTATSLVIDQLRDTYDFPIIGMEPAVRPALQRHQNGRVLVLATELTLQEHKYQNLVDQLGRSDEIDELALPELVEAAEEFNFHDDKLSINIAQKLKKFDLNAIHTVVLGCTHYVYFYPLLKSILPAHIQLIDGNKGTVNRLKSLIVPNNIENPTVKYLLSGKLIDPELIKPYLDYLEYDS
jgi:glutamate racemase